MGAVKSLNALIYLRVSTEEQAEKGYSIQIQRTEGVNRAVELGCDPDDIYIFGDEGASGAVLERPQLMAALDMLKKRCNEIDYFICYDSSRLSRNAAHQLIIVDEIKKCGTQLIFIRNNFQDNAEGRFQLTIMAAVDEYERERLRFRTEMGKRAKAAQHKLTHNPGLYGYDFDSKTDTLIVNEGNAKNLRMIFRLLTEEYKGPAEIAEILNVSGIPSPRMSTWSRVTVRRILSNPSYLGILHIRRYDTRGCYLNKFKKTNEKIKVREKPQNEWVPVQIPQIIEADVWEKAQVILKESQYTGRKKDKTDFLLTPLLRCGICGNIMNGKRIVKGDSSYRYYVCKNKYKDAKGKRCDSRIIKAESIEKAVWDDIYARICFFAENEMNLGKAIDKFVSEKENDIKNRFVKNEKAINEKDRILTMFQKSYISEDEMSKRMKSHLKKMTELNEETAKNKEDIKLIERLKNNRRREELSYVIEESINELKDKDRKCVLESLISKITVSDDIVLIKERV